MDEEMKFYRAAWNTIFAPWWKLWLARLLGEVFTGRDENCTVKGYYWRGKFYLTESRHDDIGSADDRLENGRR